MSAPPSVALYSVYRFPDESRRVLVRHVPECTTQHEKTFQSDTLCSSPYDDLWSRSVGVHRTYTTHVKHPAQYYFVAYKTFTEYPVMTTIPTDAEWMGVDEEWTTRYTAHLEDAAREKKRKALAHDLEVAQRELVGCREKMERLQGEASRCETKIEALREQLAELLRIPYG